MQLSFQTGKPRLRAAALVAAFAAWVMPAASVTADTRDIDVSVLLEVLVEKGILTDAEVERALERSRRRAEEEAARVGPVADLRPGVHYEPAEPMGTEPVPTRVRKFGVETPDGRDRFRIRGRLMADFAYVDWDDAQNTIDGDMARYGSIIRRARLGVLGIWNYDWEWQMEVDFRDLEVRFANAYIAYLGWDQSRFAIGHFKEPFSMESSTSSRRITFIERATPVDAYRPDRELGFLYETIRPNMYVGLGAFGGDSVVRNRRVTEGFSLAGRASFAPINEEDRFLHIGGSANYRKNAYRQREGRNREYLDVRLRSRLGTRAVDGRMIGLNDIPNVKDFSRAALELAKGWGPFAVQGEYLWVDVNRDFGLESLTLKGWYAQASWFLTGETHTYRAESGDMGAPMVNHPFGSRDGGPGAWQLALRYATADSNSRDYDGHAMDHWTLGLNWFPIPEIVLKLNYAYVDAENLGGERTTANVFAFRAQLEF